MRVKQLSSRLNEDYAAYYDVAQLLMKTFPNSSTPLEMYREPRNYINDTILRVLKMGE